MFISSHLNAQKLGDIPPPPPQNKKVKKRNKNKSPKGEMESEFPGGSKGWREFLQNNLNADVPSKNGASAGIYIVILRFLINKEGIISDIVVDKDPGYGTGEEALRVMKLSPNWIPGMQNGNPVNSIKSQSIAFQVSK